MSLWDESEQEPETHWDKFKPQVRVGLRDVIEMWRERISTFAEMLRQARRS